MDMRRETKTAVLAGVLIVGLLYLACVTWDLLGPRFAMNSAWAPLFPGFTWLTGGAFLLGAGAADDQGADGQARQETTGIRAPPHEAARGNRRAPGRTSAGRARPRRLHPRTPRGSGRRAL